MDERFREELRSFDAVWGRVSAAKGPARARDAKTAAAASGLTLMPRGLPGRGGACPRRCRPRGCR